MHILHTVLNTFSKENLFTDQKFLLMVIISFILMTLMCDSGLILWGEIRCSSLLGFKGLKKPSKCDHSKNGVWLCILKFVGESD